MHLATTVLTVLSLATAISAGSIPSRPQPKPMTCKTSTVNPKPAKVICGGHGTLSAPTYRPGYPLPSSTLEDCRDDCLGDKLCKSFSYGEDGTCAHFTKAILKQGWKKDSSVTVSFSNRRCFKRECNCEDPDFPDLGEDGLCYDFSFDDKNCGSFGHQCDDNEFCFFGDCNSPV